MFSRHTYKDAAISGAMLVVAFASIWGTYGRASLTLAEQPPVRPAFSSHVQRVAVRLQRRIYHRFHTLISPRILSQAVQHRQELLQGFVTPVLDTRTSLPTLTIAEHPEWIRFDIGVSHARFEMDPEAIAFSIDRDDILPVAHSLHSYVTGFHERNSITRAQFAATPRSGFAFSREDAAQTLAAALEVGELVAIIPSQYETAQLTLPAEMGSQTLTLLSSGRSNFTNSPKNRVWNIQKALLEHINGAIVQPGETFSFNKFIEPPITLSKGWKEALGIFQGGAKLEMTPGGGVCQAATTTFRAALLAGLPFTRYKPHSLYVTYYEVGGVGLDATIFPNAQDLSFVNDTSGPIVIHSHIDGDDAFVDFYGIPDGRTVALDGPYFNGSEWAPSLLPELRTNEIGWVRQIVAADGTVEQEPFVSRYSKGIPRLRLLKDVASGQQHMYLHASAGVTQ